MNQQIIESLLMDRALDMLSPDTEQLLDDYLSEHPEFQLLAHSIDDTVGLGRKSVCAPVPENVPPFSRAWFYPPAQPFTGPSMRGWRSLAAGILLGVGISYVFMPGRGVEKRASTPAFTTVESVETAPRASGLDTAQAFWSIHTYKNRYGKHLGNVN